MFPIAVHPVATLAEARAVAQKPREAAAVLKSKVDEDPAFILFRAEEAAAKKFYGIATAIIRRAVIVADNRRAAALVALNAVLELMILIETHCFDHPEVAAPAWLRSADSGWLVAASKKVAQAAVECGCRLPAEKRAMLSTRIFEKTGVTAAWMLRKVGIRALELRCADI